MIPSNTSTFWQLCNLKIDTYLQILSEWCWRTSRSSCVSQWSQCTLISVTNVTDRPSMCQYCASLAVNFLSWVAAALTGQPNTPAAGHLAWACLPRSLVTRQHGHEKLFRFGDFLNLNHFIYCSKLCLLIYWIKHSKILNLPVLFLSVESSLKSEEEILAKILNLS